MLVQCIGVLPRALAYKFGDGVSPSSWTHEFVRSSVLDLHLNLVEYVAFIIRLPSSQSHPSTWILLGPVPGCTRPKMSSLRNLSYPLFAPYVTALSRVSYSPL